MYHSIRDNDPMWSEGDSKEPTQLPPPVFFRVPMKSQPQVQRLLSKWPISLVQVHGSIQQRLALA